MSDISDGKGELEVTNDLLDLSNVTLRILT